MTVTTKNIMIRAETDRDREAICCVNRLAFGRDAEARLVDALRDGGYLRLSLVAEVGERIVGHILFSGLPIVAPCGIVPALSLAPVAVLPDFQRQGIGSALIRCGLDVCREQGHRIVIVLGHPGYYPRFGFSPALARRLDSPYAGDSFMAVELAAGAMDGVSGAVHYPPPFANV